MGKKRRRKERKREGKKAMFVEMEISYSLVEASSIGYFLTAGRILPCCAYCVGMRINWDLTYTRSRTTTLSAVISATIPGRTLWHCVLGVLYEF